MKIIPEVIQLGFDSPHLCECGCGRQTTIYVGSSPTKGYIKGQPKRTIRGHYRRTRTRIPVEERFWKYVNKTGSCWPWTGATREFGYGVINMGGRSGKTEAAHRLSWVIHNGPIPDGLFVCHKCDNPPCVNPDHLFLGTNADNMRDCASKGRYDRLKRPKGELHGRAILTADKVIEIRSLYASGDFTLHELGNQYGVSYQTIWRVVKRHTWPHI